MENKDKTSERGKFREYVTKYGSYALLMLCIAAIATAACFLLPAPKQEQDFASDTHKQDGNKDQTADLQNSTSAENGSFVSGSKDESFNDMLNPQTGKPYNTEASKGEVKQTPTPDFTPAPSDNAQQQKLLPSPVNGEITWDFAMDELIYSQTLDQWTTHCGVDISCKKGDNVRAVADGTVESVYNDDAYGITVVIKHKNGHVSIYSSLADDKNLPKEGSSVKANAIIGVCGNTSKFECSDKSHIHFEYHVNGKPQNPSKYVLIKKAS